VCCFDRFCFITFVTTVGAGSMFIVLVKFLIFLVLLKSRLKDMSFFLTLSLPSTIAYWSSFMITSHVFWLQTFLPFSSIFHRYVLVSVVRVQILKGLLGRFGTFA
jgi:hypothetical protein